MLAHVIFASLMCLGIYVSMTPGMILGGLGDRIESLGRRGKPLGSCLTCMASVYGSLYWLAVFGFPTTVIALVTALSFIVALAGLNFILNTSVVKRAEEY